MITLMASLVGFVSSIIPELINIFKDIRNQRYSLELLDRKIEILGNDTIRDLNPNQVYPEMLGFNNPVMTNRIHITWIDKLNATVRPVLAYSFFLMYMLFKYKQYTVSESINALWNIDDQTVFASVISFYFGNRAFSRSQIGFRNY